MRLEVPIFHVIADNDAGSIRVQRRLHRNSFVIIVNSRQLGTTCATLPRKLNAHARLPHPAERYVWLHGSILVDTNRSALHS